MAPARKAGPCVERGPEAAPGRGESASPGSGNGRDAVCARRARNVLSVRGLAVASRGAERTAGRMGVSRPRGGTRTLAPVARGLGAASCSR